ncbi:MAG: RodZ domain-containing protein [Thiobacillaceae bacterium]|jgi:cytoskeleton protein RodZ
MNAEVQSVGAELKTAREAQALTLEQAALRLHLMNRQVSAMEEDDFAMLGQPVYARGFVRNYARMLGLDAEAIVARLDDVGLEEPQKIENLPLVQPQTLMTSPWVLAALVLLVVVIAIPVGLYLWLNSGEESASVAPAPVVPVTTPAKPFQPAAGPAPSAQTEPVKPAATAETKSAGEVKATAKTTATAEPPVPDSAITIAPIPPANPAPTNSEQDEGGAPPTLSNIKLYFDEDAWVEVNEDSGRVLFHKLGVAGTSVTLTGMPPFSFVIGNAAHVRMTYNGRPLDLTPYIDVKVARFNLEE